MSTNTIIAAVILVVGVIGFALGGKHVSRTEPVTLGQKAIVEQQSDAAVATSSRVSVSTSGNKKLAPVMVGVASSTAPSLTKKVSYASDFPAEARPIIEKKIADLRATLAKNYEDYSAWLNVAIYYKQAGDYAQAEAVWLYLATLHPDDAVSRHNLGDLYAHYLKDYPKAETYYQQAIAIKPESATDYLALSELYRYSYKQNTSAAVDILKQGIAHVPEPQVEDIKNALAVLQQKTI